jgi:hypothetical protein
MNMQSNKTPLQKLLRELEKNHSSFKNANLLLAAGIVDPTIRYAKEELLLEELMLISTEFQKGYDQGYKAGKIEASMTKI